MFQWSESGFWTSTSRKLLSVLPWENSWCVADVSLVSNIRFLFVTARSVVSIKNLRRASVSNCTDQMPPAPLWVVAVVSGVSDTLSPLINLASLTVTVAPLYVPVVPLRARPSAKLLL